MSCVLGAGVRLEGFESRCFGGLQDYFSDLMQGRFLLFLLLGGIKRKGTHFGACSCFSPVVIGVCSFDAHDVLRNTAAAVALYVLH
jgi:hypothetical protein